MSRDYVICDYTSSSTMNKMKDEEDNPTTRTLPYKGRTQCPSY